MSKKIFVMLAFGSLFLLASCNHDKVSTVLETPEKSSTDAKEVVVQNTPVVEESGESMKDSMEGKKEEAVMMDDNMEETKESIKEKMDSMAMKDDEMKKEPAEEKAPVVTSTPGEYADYSSEKLTAASGDVVLFFAATWCSSCRSLDKNLSAATVPDGVTILKVDYDSNLDLRKKYEVLSQHTLVQVDNKGNFVKKWVGGNKIGDITDMIN